MTFAISKRPLTIIAGAHRQVPHLLSCGGSSICWLPEGRLQSIITSDMLELKGVGIALWHVTDPAGWRCASTAGNMLQVLSSMMQDLRTSTVLGLDASVVAGAAVQALPLAGSCASVPAVRLT